EGGAAAGAVAAALLVLGVRAAAVPGQLASPAASGSAAPVEAWLLAHGFSRGYAGYWDADIMTLESHGRLQVLPVTGAGDRVAPFHYLSTERWYRDPGAHARYLVLPLDTTGPD